MKRILIKISCNKKTNTTTPTTTTTSHHQQQKQHQIVESAASSSPLLETTTSTTTSRSKEATEANSESQSAPSVRSLLKKYYCFHRKEFRRKARIYGI